MVVFTQYFFLVHIFLHVHQSDNAIPSQLKEALCCRLNINAGIVGFIKINTEQLYVKFRCSIIIPAGSVSKQANCTILGQLLVFEAGAFQFNGNPVVSVSKNKYIYMFILIFSIFVDGHGLRGDV